MSTRVEWSGHDAMKRRMQLYAVAIQQTIWSFAEYWAPQLETYSKQNAPWTDRTGLARASLWCRPMRLSDEAIAIILSHGVEYGVWLEIRHQARYAILWPTLQAHFRPIADMLQNIFR